MLTLTNNPRVKMMKKILSIICAIMLLSASAFAQSSSAGSSSAAGGSAGSAGASAGATILVDLVEASS